MQKPEKKKLSLSKESLRTLTEAEEKQVVGGDGPPHITRFPSCS